MNLHKIKYLLCYDVSDPRRLRRVHRVVRDWGIPIQFSVFEIDLMPVQMEKLLAELTALIEATEDKVIFYRLSPHQERISLGQAIATEDLLFI
jgi:CRISPR-associated protein Cas2